MRIKALRDLAQLNDRALFPELQEGIRLCHENAKRIMDDVAALAVQGRFQAATILQNVANEEAAKALILLDVARCPRKADATLSRQLFYFTDHLAKGLYTSICEIRPCSFGEVHAWVDRQRKDFYLDGPNGADWIFANDIVTSREQSMYVDYIFADERRWWHDPASHRVPLFGVDDFRPSAVFRLAAAFRDAGCFSADALAVISEIWRSIVVHDGMTIHELRNLNEVTLKALNEKSLLRDAGQDAFRLIVNEGIFPLYTLDLRKEQVDKAELEAIRANSAHWG